MFPQFYFLSSISTKTPSYQHKISQIRKQLLLLNNSIGVVVVAGSLDSIKMGEQLFGEQKIKSKMFVQGLMKDRVNIQEDDIIKFSSQQTSKYPNLYRNFEQFMQQQSQTNFPLENNLIAFTSRIKQLKQSIVHYKNHISLQKQQKILLIADKQVLNYLAATDYHENGQPVNRLHFNQGQTDLVSLVVDQEELMRELRRGDGIFCG